MRGISISGLFTFMVFTSGLHNTRWFYLGKIGAPPAGCDLTSTAAAATALPLLMASKTVAYNLRQYIDVSG